MVRIIEFFFYFFPSIVVILSQTLFFIYLFQLKEYRFDRFFSHLKTAEGRRSIFSYVPCLYFLVFLIVISLMYLEKLEGPPCPTCDIFNFKLPIILGAILLLYIILFVRVIYRVIRKKLFRPKFTQKTIVFVLAVFGTFLPLIAFSKFSIFINIFFLNLLLPFIVLFWLFILQILTFFMKKIIFIRAEQKMRKFPHLRVIGITGSYGKSSTKHFLATILSKRFKVLKTEGNINSEIGVAQTILQHLKPEHEVFIVEMGAYKRGEIAAMCKMTRPRIGILTAVNEQHLSLFGSIENIKNAKYELIEALPDDGLAIFNGDNAHTRALYGKMKGAKVLYFLMKPKVRDSAYGEFLQRDFSASDIKIDSDGLHFTVHKGEASGDFHVNVLGAHNVSNILAATAAADYFGMDLKEIALAARDIQPEEKMMRILTGIKGTTLLDDSYSANPDGVMAALKYLKTFSGKKVMIMRSMIELGDASKEAHQRVGKEIGKVCDLCIMTTSDYFEDLKQAAIASGMAHEKILQISSPKEIIKTVDKFVTEGDVILLENRVPKTIVDEIRTPLNPPLLRGETPC